ncbi:MAG TPA: VOC family protein [Stellaceae bacterium]|jgi:catechol 2,3-dioxygenase|nr:VOC family protein [Stellaceae bacterium]
MAQAYKVDGIRSVDFGVTDLKAAERFYTEVWNLKPVASSNGSVYLRGTGYEHHILGLHQRNKGELLRVNLSAPDEEAVNAIHERVRKTNIRQVEAPGAIDEPGGGYGFAFQDPEGRTVRVIAGMSSHVPEKDDVERPKKLSHCVLNSGTQEDAVKFWCDALGTRVIDRTKAMTFVNLSSDHHSVAIVKGSGPTLHHVAFEMPSIEAVMRGGGRLKDAGHPIEWGVGRHGPGNNVFAYFIGPEEMVIEYTAEVEQVDDKYKVGGPDEWTWKPGRNDQWGINPGPSKRMQDAHNVRFAEDLFHPA